MSWRTQAWQTLSQRVAGTVGGSTAAALKSLGIVSIDDLLRHVPKRYMRSTDNSSLSDLQPGDEVSLLLRVVRSEAHPTRRARMWRLSGTLTDGHDTIDITFFGRQHYVEHWHGQLKPGVQGLFAGKVGVYRDRFQITHPDYITFDEQGRVNGGAKRNVEKLEWLLFTSGFLGIYPATAKLPTWRIAECISTLGLPLVEDLPEPLPAEVLASVDVVELAEAESDPGGFCHRYRIDPQVFAGRGLPTLAEAFAWVHRPPDLESAFLGRQRLVFDEAFAVQATMAHRRVLAQRQPAQPRPRRDAGIAAAFDQSLPFELTEGQHRVGEQIAEAMTKEHPMQLLLQGEVGSGKTLVALRAMLDVVDNGGQAVLMAPTEVLAAQHAATIREQLGELAQGAGLFADDQHTEVVLLSGSLPAAQRKKVLLKIASGEAGIVIGTHALLADEVQYADLGLVVVDEQHRFGVEQRALLSDRAERRPHLLVMTATPIPRTVAMTSFGDLDVATLREIPAGRAEVSTTVVDEIVHPHWVDRAWQRVAEEAEAGRQTFIVCSQIDGEELPRPMPRDRHVYAKHLEDGGDPLPPRGAEPLHAWLSSEGGPLAHLRVGLLHGRMSSEDKDRTMDSFAAGDLDVLVATTVIEVGVNVPNAAVMVISDADRFGISQLHQLRGRIGRGSLPGTCLLLTTMAPDSDARARLDALSRTRDGFQLAEVDLAQRREGDVLGADQSGSRSSLRLLRVLEHVELIEQAGAAAEKWIAHDPDLDHPGIADAVDRLAERAEAEFLERG